MAATPVSDILLEVDSETDTSDISVNVLVKFEEDGDVLKMIDDGKLNERLGLQGGTFTSIQLVISSSSPTNETLTVDVKVHKCAYGNVKLSQNFQTVSSNFVNIIVLFMSSY